MKEAVQLAIGGASAIGARASATLTDLLASSGVQVVRTGSVVLEWPNAALPSDPTAWDSPAPAERDPVAFAFRQLHGAAAEDPWATPVDAIRAQVADWVRGERLRVAAPWPEGATCAIALVHEARPFPTVHGGLRGRLARGAKEPPLQPYERIAAVERAHRVHSALRSVDLLEPEQQAQVRVLGFALDTPPGIRIAARPGFRRGTAFPTRGYDAAAERADDWIELPLLGDEPDPGLRTLLDVGGGAALSIRVERFAGEHAEEEAVLYDALLGRLLGLGAWLTTPEELLRRLYA
ncbi:MAG: hypothetical protein ACR2JV_08890 [Gaiellales bacterium]